LLKIHLKAIFNVKFISTEALTLPPNSKQNYIAKVSNYKKRYTSSYRDLGSLKVQLGQNNGGDIENEGEKVDQYLKSLSKNNNRLSQAIRVGSETENVARDIKLGLNSNSEKLNRASHNVGRVQTQLALSNKLVDIIRRNELRNRIVLY
jgi:hypothetical protein